jgi:hypothetical protein
MPTVQATITARSVSEPRTKAIASASAMPNTVSSRVSGTRTVSEGPSRLAMICATGSPVLQALPKSKLRICLTKIPSCTHQGWSMPSWARMLAIAASSAILPASRYAGSPPTQLNSRNTSTITPAMVGSICHSRRKI